MLRALILWMMSRVVPTGGAISYRGTTAPNGAWLVEDGSAVSRTTYAALFAVQGTSFGVGDGSTTFNLCDCRGRVIVFLGTNASVSSLNLNDGQSVANRRPQHRTTNSLGLNDPGHTHTQNRSSGTGSSGDSGQGDNSSVSAFQSTQSSTTGISLTGSIGTNNANDALDAPSYVVAGVSIVKT